jgi:hypothetical protein
MSTNSRLKRSSVLGTTMIIVVIIIIKTQPHILFKPLFFRTNGFLSARTKRKLSKWFTCECVWGHQEVTRIIISSSNQIRLLISTIQCTFRNFDASITLARKKCTRSPNNNELKKNIFPRIPTCALLFLRLDPNSFNSKLQLKLEMMREQANGAPKGKIQNNIFLRVNFERMSMRRKTIRQAKKRVAVYIHLHIKNNIVSSTCVAISFNSHSLSHANSFPYAQKLCCRRGMRKRRDKFLRSLARCSRGNYKQLFLHRKSERRNESQMLKTSVVLPVL